MTNNSVASAPLTQGQFETHIYNVYHPDHIHPDILANSRLVLDDMQNHVNQSWEFCASVLNNTKQPEVHRFCLSQFKLTLSQHIYEGLSPEKQQKFKSSLTFWFERVCKDSNMTARYAVSELGSVYSLLFRREFPAIIPTFFDDLFQQTNQGPSGIFPVLEILRIISEDVIIDESKSSPIKKATHEHAEKIISFFYRLVSHFSKTRVDLAQEALKTLEVFIPWVEMSLFINVRFKNLFEKLVLDSNFSCSVLSVYLKIIKRGMYPVHRLETFITLDMFNLSINLATSLRTESSLASTSALINAIAEYLIDFLEIVNFKDYGPPIPLFSSPVEFQACCKAKLKVLLPFVVKLFSANSHDISLPVVPALTRWIHFLEKHPPKNQSVPSTIFQILQTLPAKFQLPHNFTLDNITDDQDKRLTSRSHYSKVLHAIFRYNPVDTFKFIEGGMNKLIESNNLPFYQQEAILTLFWRVGEYYNSITYKHNQSSSSKSGKGNPNSQSNTSKTKNSPGVEFLLSQPVTQTPLFSMFSRMIQSDIHNYIKRPIVLEAIFKNIVRYLKTFGDSLPKQCWESCLKFFLGPAAIYNESSPAIRSRSYYHLYLLVQASPSIVLDNFQSQILNAITPLLSISSSSIGDGIESLGITTPPVSPSHSPRGQSKASTLQSVYHASKVSFDTQLFLYRIISILACEKASTSQQLGVDMMRHFLSPVMIHLNSLKSTAQHWNNPNDPKSFVRVLLIRRDVDALVSLSKEVHVKSPLAPLFHSTISDIGETIFLLPQYDDLRDTVIVYLHSMIPLLQPDNIQLVLKVIKRISTLADLAQMRKVVQLLCQIVARIGVDSVPFIQSILLPLTSSLHECVKRRGPIILKSDLAKEVDDIWIEYYKFLNYIFVHKAGAAFWSPDIFPSFPKLVEQIAMDSINSSIRRTTRCLVFLHHLVNNWPPSKMAILSQFVQNEVIPLAFASILRGTLATEKMAATLANEGTITTLAISPIAAMAEARKRDSIRPESSNAGDVAAGVALILHSSFVRLGDASIMNTISKLLTPLGVPLPVLQSLSSDLGSRRINKVKAFLKKLMNMNQ